MRIETTLSVVAVGADAGDLEAVKNCDEAMALRGLVDPAVEVATVDFDDAMAAVADEMVVVGLALAQPVALLAAGVV
jgi:hypothetical protein